MSATISECGRYRYDLHRSLGSVLRGYKPMFFVMLNPSTADASLDDPTIRRCKAFAKREGATHLVVLNLFALRSTDPSGLAIDHDPIGPNNDAFLEKFLRPGSDWNVAAWGSHPFAKNRAREIQLRYGPFKCLGMTKDGSPRHPLYVKADAPLIEWKP